MRGKKIVLILVLINNFLTMHGVLSAQGRDADLLDRAVLQISRSVYTQQEIEWYILCKLLLSPEEPAFKDFASEIRARWTYYLQLVEPDLVLLDDAQRLNVFIPPIESQKRAQDFIYERINENATFTSWVQSSGLDDTIITQNIIRLLQIEGYKLSKQRHGQATSQRDGNSQKAPSLIQVNDAWYGDLLAKTQLKYFKDAFVYRPLKKLSL